MVSRPTHPITRQEIEVRRDKDDLEFKQQFRHSSIVQPQESLEKLSRVAPK